MITAETITTAQIDALRREAAEAGDTIQVALCQIALTSPGIDGLDQLYRLDLSDDMTAALAARGVDLGRDTTARDRARALCATALR